MISNEPVDSWCPLLTNGSRFSVNNGALQWAPCCFTPAHNATNCDAKSIKLLRNQLRKQARINPQSICGACVTQEAAGKISMRMGYQMQFANLDSDSTMIEIGNDIRCNAACIMCNGNLSTLWQQELGKKITVTQQSTNQLTQQVLDLIDIEQVKIISFAGGEPLLTSTHTDILSASPDLSDVIISYHTNGSILPDDHTLHLWGKAKKVLLFFSIDGIDQQFEYIRWPLQWTTVSKNLETMVSWLAQGRFQGQAKVHITSNPLSAWYVDQIENYFTALSKQTQCWIGTFYDLATGRFDLRATSPALRQLIKDKHGPAHQITKFLEQLPFDSKMHQQLMYDLVELDTRRKNKWQETFPEIVNFL